MRFPLWPFLASLLGPFAVVSEIRAAALGVFEGQSDVGTPKRAGFAEFDQTQRSYKVAGGGQNMWFTNDALHFVWRKVSGNVTLAADITFDAACHISPSHSRASLISRCWAQSDPESLTQFNCRGFSW